MKKLVLLLILVVSIFTFNFNGSNKVLADSFSDNTLIFAHYNNKAEFYDNLAGITQFSLNDDIIVYTLDGTNIQILNKSTKQVSSLSVYGTTFDNIKDIQISKNFLFVHDDNGLSAYTLKNFVKVNIYIDVAKTTSLPNYKSFSIAENTDRLTIACINDNEFISYFLSPLDLSYISRYTNTAINNQTQTMLNIVTNTNSAYIVNDSTNSESSSLWKIDYNNSIQFTKSLFPKPNITSLVLYTYDETDYLLAINNTNVIYVLRTDLQYSNNNDDFDADQTRNGNTTDTRFVTNDLSLPNDIILHNNDIYISDSGTKCIQKFSFQLTTDNKGSIVGSKIILASECGEVGRFNQNSNIEFIDNKLIVADSNNRRVQIINDGDVTCLDKNVLTNLTVDNLTNLDSATIIDNTVYFASYNQNLNKQNIYSYNLETNITKSITHSIEKVLDITTINNSLYILGTNGIFEINTINEVCYTISHTIFGSGRITNIGNDQLVISVENNLHLYDTSGIHLTTITIDKNIQDISSDDTTLYALIPNNKTIQKYNISYNNIALLCSLSYSFGDTDYNSISIDKTNGIIYLFDNKCCRIDKIMNPAFNYKNISGIYQVNNKNVFIYDRPYFLNGVDTPVILQKLKVNNRITIYSTASINYGNIEYYIIDLDDGDYGYINKNDLTYLSEVINYEIIYPNATLRTFDDTTTVKVYLEADETSLVVSEIETGTRVLTIDYDNNSDYTFVRFYDKNQNLIEGYVKTGLINTDNITQTQSTALILITCSIVLIISIAIVVSIIYKKRAKKLAEEN